MSMKPETPAAAYLSDEALCDAIAHIAKDEPTVHPSVRPAADAAADHAARYYEAEIAVLQHSQGVLADEFADTVGMLEAERTRTDALVAALEGIFGDDEEFRKALDAYTGEKKC